MIKRYLITFTVFIFFILCLCCSSYGLSSSLCIENNKTLSYLKNNFDELYQSDYHLFWDILRDAEKKALRCKSIKDTATFLELARIKSINAEFNEYLSEIIEKLVVRSPKCFFDSVSTLDEETISNITSKLQNPIFIEMPKIKEVFLKNKHKRKYRKIMTFYFKR